jgi:hypothetical protein
LKACAASKRWQGSTGACRIHQFGRRAHADGCDRRRVTNAGCPQPVGQAPRPPAATHPPRARIRSRAGSRFCLRSARPANCREQPQNGGRVVSCDRLSGAIAARLPVIPSRQCTNRPLFPATAFAESESVL